MIRNTASEWGLAARVLHWAGALLIAYLLAHGWWMTHMAAREARLPNYALHADLGYVLLALVLIRLAWRWMEATPDLPPDSRPWERWAAHAVHWSLYGLMLAASLTGWALAGTFRQPFNRMLGGLIEVPALVTSQERAVHGFFEETHGILAWVLLAAVGLHVAAALRHHFVKRNDILRRMIWIRRGGEIG
jgi:cytochrome b561